MGINRRQFIGAAVASSVAVPAVFAADAAADKKIRIGLIGAGGYGMANIRAALKVGGVEIAALCDVDSEHLAKAADDVEKAQGKKPATFKLYDAMLKDAPMDAAIIGTPPQWHALQFIACLEKGLDVYCEKPLAYDIREGRAMADAAKKAAKQVVQVGFQRRQAGGFKAAREYLASGALGKIVQVEAQIHYNANPGDPTPKDPPASLDWDLWCGPAPKIPYSTQVGHRSWRLEKTTGHGHLVDWGIHLIDQVRWLLGEKTPKSVQASGGLYQYAGKITTPDMLEVWFEFEKCPAVWKHRIWGAEEYTPETSNGIFFYGEKETLFVTDNKWVVIPRGKSKERKENVTKSDAGKDHMAEFLQAVKTRQQPSCSVEDAHQSTATVKLAMISYDTGRKITWDGATEQIINDPEASKLLKREYRGPWKHPFAG